eukprot:CAMPEP_0185424076 /NCGR_PEP_ID=MMETSP1365-20130426/12942_1 /TAXON_ID=38817 /ORGANISM="Gephyrocapsa oceanica, Strain RCC1303" /LENGTH=38 /DNA_ID= /DNA_START= /DNA_END= /DNA_ORIENTATION=
MSTRRVPRQATWFFSGRLDAEALRGSLAQLLALEPALG